MRSAKETMELLLKKAGYVGMILILGIACFFGFNPALSAHADEITQGAVATQDATSTATDPNQDPATVATTSDASETATSAATTTTPATSTDKASAPTDTKAEATASTDTPSADPTPATSDSPAPVATTTTSKGGGATDTKPAPKPTTSPAPVTSKDKYNVLLWEMPGGKDHPYTPAQVLADHVLTNTVSLNLLDASPALKCETDYQVDFEHNSKTTDYLVSVGFLYGANNPTEDHAYEAFPYGNPWKWFTTPACGSGSTTSSQSVCQLTEGSTTDYAPTSNTITIAPSEGSKAVIAIGDSPLYKAIDAGTFKLSDIGDFSYPLTLHVKYVGALGDFSKTDDVTFQAEKTAVDCGYSASISFLCTENGPVVHSDLTVGFGETTFDLFINREQAAEKIVKAGQPDSFDFQVGEGSNNGEGTATVKVNGSSVTDVISFSTDCIQPPVTVIIYDANPVLPKVPAQCLVDGKLPELPVTADYTAKYLQKFHGPGDYTAVFTTKKFAPVDNVTTVVHFEGTDSETFTGTVHVPAKGEGLTNCVTASSTPAATPPVTAAGTTPPTGLLAYTGSDPKPASIGGLALLLTGLALIIPASRRRIFGFFGKKFNTDA